jgi:CII-binding regulator of phage lambda lysogenization HflD
LVGHIKCENTYNNIDDLFSSNVLTLENKIKSKKTILESLKNKPQEHKEVIEVPLNSMVNVANKTVEKYISSLSESEQKELKSILSTPKESLIENYGKIKDEVVSKLNTQKEGSDSETQETINKVLNKVQTESFNELNYYKLKQLNEVL